MRGLLCTLEAFDDSHLDTIATWLAHTECESLLRGSSNALLRSSEYRALEHGSSRAVLILDRDRTVVGVGHFWKLGEGTYEVGGATGNPALWGTGIGIEAALLLVDYLFEVRNARRVEYTTGVHNRQTLAIGLSDEMRIEAVCDDYFQTPTGPLPAVKSSQTRCEYADAADGSYQPRVGRRLDLKALDTLYRRVVSRQQRAPVSLSRDREAS